MKTLKLKYKYKYMYLTFPITSYCYYDEYECLKCCATEDHASPYTLPSTTSH